MKLHQKLAINSFYPNVTTPFSTFCIAFNISVTGQDRHFEFGGYRFTLARPSLSVTKRP